MKRESHPLFLRKFLSLCLITAFAFGLLFSMSLAPLARAYNLLATTGTQVGTSTMTEAGMVANPTPNHYSCFIGGIWFVIWIQSGTTPNPIVFNYVYSSSGSTWSSAALFYSTSVTLPAATSPNGFGLACYAVSGAAKIILSWTNSATNLAAPYYQTFTVANPASPSADNAGVDQQISGCASPGFALAVDSVFVDALNNKFITWGYGSNTFASNNGAALNACAGIAGIQAGTGPVVQVDPNPALSGNPRYVIYQDGSAPSIDLKYGVGGTAFSAAANICGGLATYVTVSGVGETITPSGTCTGTGQNANACFLMTFSYATNAWTKTTPTGDPTTGCGSYGFNSGGRNVLTNGYAVSDGSLNIWMVQALSVTANVGVTLTYSQDGGSTWVVSSFVQTAGITDVQGIITNANAGSALQALVVSVDSSKNIWVQLISAGATSATSQTQTIGSCPPGGGTGIGHYTLANNTIYFYNGNALGAEVVNSVSVEVASTKYSAGATHYLELLLYASTSTPPSIAYPNTRLYESKVFAITAGTTNSTITLQIAVPLNGATTTPLPFNWWSVGIIGDDNIRIAGSSLSGLVTQTGTTPTVSSTPPIQPLTFTSSGTASTNKLALCATGSFQSVVGGFATTTISSVTIAATTTQTQTNIVAGLVPSTVNYSLMFFVVLFPGVVLAFVMGIASRSAPGAGIGFVAGMTVGAGLGWQAGLLPNPGILVVLLIVDVFIIVGVFTIGKGGGV